MTMLDNQPESKNKSGASFKGTDVPISNNSLVPASVFRAYDIRGTVGDQLSIENVELISRAIGTEAIALGIESLYVAYDGRVSSPELSHALISGLQKSGCNIVSLGLVPTPLLYFATHTGALDSGVMLTASHNPANYNGLKIVFNKTSLADNQIQSIRERVESQEFSSGAGTLEKLDIKAAYCREVCERISLSRPLKVVLDCGNAVPACIAPELFTTLGCEVHPLYCEIDGRFPNHHPDPTVASNLASLSEEVLTQNADIGIAFDGDGDRLGIVTNLGEVVNADKMMMLLVDSIAERYQGESVVFDVKCSKALNDRIQDTGMIPQMHRSGHSFMKQKMLETNAPLGGEYAAHIFIEDDWYGFDDGMYAAARIVEVLAASDESASEIFNRYNVPFSTEEIKLPIAEDIKFQTMQKILEATNFPDGKCITLDGLRVEFADGWGLIRASNTSPALLLRFEANTAAGLESIKDRFKALIGTADKSIELNF